jgi:hypothetical protein
MSFDFEYRGNVRKKNPYALIGHQHGEETQQYHEFGH